MASKSILAFLTALLFSVSAWAGLGQIVLQSHLGEPLRAVVPLSDVGAKVQGGVHVGLANQATFNDLNVDYDPQLSALHFSLQPAANGLEVVIRSDRPIASSYLQFVLELKTPAGRSVRAYTVLLDSPGFVAPAEGEAVPLPLDSSPAAAPASRSAARLKPALAETLAAVARRIKPAGVSLNQTMASLFLANRAQFIGGNPHRLKPGARLKTPTLTQMRALSEARARAILQIPATKTLATHGIVPAQGLAANPSLENAPVLNGAMKRLSGEPQPQTRAAPAPPAIAPPTQAPASPAPSEPPKSAVPAVDASAAAAAKAQADAITAQNQALQQQVLERSHQLQSANQHIMQLQLKIDALQASAAHSNALLQSGKKAWLLKGGIALAAILGLGLLIWLGRWLWHLARGRSGRNALAEPEADKKAKGKSKGKSDAAPGADSEQDPLALAEAHLAAGREPEAEKVLSDALQQAPARQDIRYKLMSIYAGRQDRVRFEHLAREVHDAYDGRGAIWERARVMGIGFDAENPLYQVPGAAGAAAETMLDFGGMEAMNSAGSAGQSASAPLDAMLDFEPEASMAPAAQAPVAQEKSDKDMLNFDFSLEDTAAPAAEVTPPSGMDYAGLDEMFDAPSSVSSIVLPEPERGQMQRSEAVAAANPPATAAATAGIDVEELGDAPELAPEDESLATKLDLARVYLDMGDSEGAREVLQELMQEAQGSLKQKASDMLMQLVN